ncbi:hypothetical protein [Segniliparus rugosus]|uniref:Uncharacterized protein n=1 Tax=Segniliparus rugosus (strain ATCC BAA-974 / DSM 45345 / CCUG 50838 / CIP 108380 / JCM 13579 / CDC 945) TaxID=679197 RepID=E5XQI2_SEGRC|nr:hypothetical protein [Segniliparus rugosus]EFV13400.1 hypothetical protein HMPREF9336_01754 [Segniliparus rugosus ATCC BAA-974]
MTPFLKSARARASVAVIVVCAASFAAGYWWTRPVPFPDRQLSEAAHAADVGDYAKADSLLLGGDGSNSGSEALGALLTRRWDQDCKSAADFLTKITSSRPTSNAGAITRALAVYTVAHEKELSQSVPLLRESFGARCPALARALAKAFAAYLPAMYGEDQGASGFTPGLKTADVTKLAAVIGTDRTAGNEFGKQGRQLAEKWEREFADSVVSGEKEAATHLMREAGELVGSLDRAHVGDWQHRSAVVTDFACYAGVSVLIQKQGAPETGPLNRFLVDGHLPGIEALDGPNGAELGDELRKYLSSSGFAETMFAGVQTFKESYDRVQHESL